MLVVISSFIHSFGSEGDIQHDNNQGFEPESIPFTIEHENIGLGSGNPVQPDRDYRQQIQIRRLIRYPRKRNTYEHKEPSKELKWVDRCRRRQLSHNDSRKEGLGIIGFLGPTKLNVIGFILERPAQPFH